jgi:hypothetical protein
LLIVGSRAWPAWREPQRAPFTGDHAGIILYQTSISLASRINRNRKPQMMVFNSWAVDY